MAVASGNEKSWRSHDQDLAEVLRHSARFETCSIKGTVPPKHETPPFCKSAPISQGYSLGAGYTISISTTAFEESTVIIIDMPNDPGLKGECSLLEIVHVVNEGLEGIEHAEGRYTLGTGDDMSECQFALPFH